MRKKPAKDKAEAGVRPPPPVGAPRPGAPEVRTSPWVEPRLQVYNKKPFRFHAMAKKRDALSPHGGDAQTHLEKPKNDTWLAQSLRIGLGPVGHTRHFYC